MIGSYYCRIFVKHAHGEATSSSRLTPDAGLEV